MAVLLSRLLCSNLERSGAGVQAKAVPVAVPVPRQALPLPLA